MMVHPIGMMRAASAASAPSFIGGASTASTNWATSVTIPFHASASNGDTIIASVMSHLTAPTVTPPAGWTLLHRVVADTSNSNQGAWMDTFIGTKSLDATSVVFTTSDNRELSGMSAAFTPCTVGNTTYKENTSPSTSSTANTVTVLANSTTCVVGFFGYRDQNVPYFESSPAADFTHNPDSKTADKAGLFTIFEDEAAGTSSAVSYTHKSQRTGSVTIELRSA